MFMAYDNLFILILQHRQVKGISEMQVTGLAKLTVLPSSLVFQLDLVLGTTLGVDSA